MNNIINFEGGNFFPRLVLLTIFTTYINLETRMTKTKTKKKMELLGFHTFLLPSKYTFWTIIVISLSIFNLFKHSLW